MIALEPRLMFDGVGPAGWDAPRWAADPRTGASEVGRAGDRVGMPAGSRSQDPPSAPRSAPTNGAAPTAAGVDVAVDEPRPASASDPAPAPATRAAASKTVPVDAYVTASSTVAVAAPVTPDPADAPAELVVVDPTVTDVDALLGALRAGVQVLVLDPGRDGLVQIAEAVAAGDRTLQAIHLVSLGSVGQLTLGTRTVDLAGLASYRSELARIGAGLASDGDLLLYGCEVGGGHRGVAFLQAIADATSADVAASTTATGAPAAGGDWTLERTVGQVEAAPALADPSAWPHLLPSAPAVSLSMPRGDVLIGEAFAFTVGFDNRGTAAGFGPTIDLFVPSSGADGGTSADGVTILGASHLGRPLALTQIVLTADDIGLGTVAHPFAQTGAHGDRVPIPGGYRPGDRLVVVELPFGGLAPDAPALEITVDARLSSFADVGTPLQIEARGAFRLGNDPLSDSTTDPTASSAPVTLAIVPSLFRLTTTYLGPENETATGPNHERAYRIDVDLAEGQTLTSVDLSTALASAMQFTAVSGTPASIGGTGLGDPPPGGWSNVNGVLVSGLATGNSAPATPGGTVSRTFAEVTGTSAAVDAAMVVAFHVPRLDSDGRPVIDPASGDARIVVAGSALAAQWAPLDARDASRAVGSSLASAHALEASSLQVQSTRSVLFDAAAPGLSPGDTLQHTLDVQVSDFFAFGHVLDGPGARGASPLQVVETLSDGLMLLDAAAGGFPDPVLTFSRGAATESLTLARGVHYAVVVLPDGRERVVFDLAAALPASAGQRLIGDLVGADLTQSGATAVRIVYSARVLSEYRVAAPDADGIGVPGPSARALGAGDRVVSRTTVSGTVLDAGLDPARPSLAGQADDSRTSGTVGTGTLSIVVWGRNGASVPIDPANPTRIAPGDTVSYVMTTTVPAGDARGLSLTAFLPLPIVSAADPNADGVPDPCVLMPGGYYPKPPVGQYSYEIVGGDGRGGAAPTVTVLGGGNALRFDFGDRADECDTPVTIRVAFTVRTLPDAPIEDGALLTAQAVASALNTANEALLAQAAVAVRTTESQLRIVHGIVGDDVDEATSVFDPSYAPVDPRALVRPAGDASASPLAAVIDAARVPLLDADVTGVDGGDALRYAIVVQNLGQSYRGAFDVTIGAALPACIDPASMSRLRVVLGDGSVIYDGTPTMLAALVRGDGTALASEADAFEALFGGAGLQLVDLAGADGIAGTADDRGRLAGTTDASGAATAAGASVIVVTYDARVRITASAGDACAATATLTHYADIEGGADRAPADPSDTAVFTVALPVLDKTIVSSSEPASTTAGERVVIGERVTYEVTLLVPEGRTRDATLVDTLAPGLSFVSIDAITASPGVTFAGEPPAPGAIVPTAAGGAANRITIPLGTITNANTDNAAGERITVRYTVVVANVAGNQEGTRQGNDARVTFAAGELATMAPDLIVVEPALALELAPSATSAGAGDRIDFELTLTAAADRPPAFDVALDIANLLPSGLTYDPASLVQVAGPPAAGLAFGGAGIVATWSRLDAGSTVVLRYTATVVAPGTVAEQNATVRYSSLPGAANRDLSPFATAGDAERTGNPADPGGVLNDHVATDAARVTTPVPLLTLVRSSEAGSSGATVVPGEVLRYRMVVQLPEGIAPDAEICPALPADVRFVNDGSATVAFVADGTSGGIDSTALSGALLDRPGGGADATAVVSVTPSYALPSAAVRDRLGAPVAAGSVMASGDSPRFALGDLTNTDCDANGEFVVIEFNAIVDNASGNIAGVDRSATFVWQTGGTVRATSNAVTVTIGEPSIVDVDKRVIAATDDAVTFELVFTHTGDQTAYDLRVLDEFAGATAVAFAGSATVSGLPPGAIDASDADTLDLRIPMLAPGESVAIRYGATLSDPSVPVAPRDAVVTYTSLSAAGTALAVTTGAGAVVTTTTGERTGDPADYGGAANTYRDADAAGLATIRGTVWDDTNEPNDAIDAGEARLGGVTVTLTHAGPDRTFGTADDGVRTARTQADGTYGFGAVPEGAVRITVPTALSAAEGGALGELRSRYDVEGLRTDGRIDLGVTGGMVHAGRDFAFVQRNDPPTVAVPGPWTVAEDTRATIPALSISDPDAGTAGSVRVTLTVGQGTLEVAGTPWVAVIGNGTPTVVLTGAVADLNAALATLGYRGAPEFNGADTLQVRVDDRGNRGDRDDDRLPNEPIDDALSAVATVPITVTPVADPPLARADRRSTSEDGPPVFGNAVAGDGVAGGQPGDVADVDPDGGPLTVVGVARGPSGGPVSGSVGSDVVGAFGTLSLNANGTYAYVPGPAAQALAVEQTAPDVFSYTIRDSEGNLATTTITIDLVGANDPPLAGDTAVTIDLRPPPGVRPPVTPPPAVSDPDDPIADLTVRIDAIQRPEAGSFTGADGTPVVPGQSITVAELQGLRYQPNPEYAPAPGPDGTLPGGVLRFTVFDPNGGSDPGTITIALRPVGAPGPLPGTPGPIGTVSIEPLGVGSPGGDRPTVGAPTGVGTSGAPAAPDSGQAIAGVSVAAPDAPSSRAALATPYAPGAMTSEARFDRDDPPLRRVLEQLRDAMLTDQQRLLDANATDLDAGGLFPSTRATGLFGDERIGPTRDWTPLGAVPEPVSAATSADAAASAPAPIVAPAARPAAAADDCPPEPKPKPKPKPVKRVLPEALQRPAAPFSEQIEQQKKQFRSPASIAPKPPPARQC